MSSFQNCFNKDFLLSSTLKPKVSTLSTSARDEKEPIEDKYAAISESKRVRVSAPASTSAIPDNSFIENASSTTTVVPPLAVPSPPLSLSDQILQVRIKLQIYQNEYAHFADCANRSSLQIQETLEELHHLVNSNFDSEASSKLPLSLSMPKPLTPESISVPLPLPVPVPKSKPQGGLSILSVKHRPRAFPRKPRCLIFNNIQPEFSDHMTTSSLDGSIQLWSKRDQRIHSSIHLPTLLGKPYFVEDLCWDHNKTGILAMGLCESSTAPINDDPPTGPSDRQLAFLHFDPRNSKSSPKLIPSTHAPHDRNICVIECWSSSSSSSSNFLTGGLDKSIYSWKVNLSNPSKPDISVRELHRRHTSSIQAVCYDWKDHFIWSGGADCRLIQWSGEEHRLVNEIRWENRISHLIKPKCHSNLMLATVTSMSAQLRLFDTRTNAVVHSFGTQESSNLSRYVRPSWHHQGNLIANGTVSAIDSVGSINIWDVRMMSSSSSGNIRPVKTIGCEDRRLVRTEFAPDGKSLVGMSTDGSLTFVEFAQYD
jgi:hypothetical protein